MALEGVPVTEFSEPAPIEAVPDAAKLQARRGFEPGRRMYPSGDPVGGSYVEEPPVPVADPPTTTTTRPPATSSTTSSSTTTTRGGLLN